jgi:hypothetical protein
VLADSPLGFAVQEWDVHPDVIENLPGLCALGDERNQPHLPAIDGAQKRDHFVDALGALKK